MIVLKYQKLNAAALAGHVDTLRALTAALRRAKVSAEYSCGFNPHMELYMSPALGLGIQSMCEYAALAAQPSQNLLKNLNAVSPPGIVFSDIFVVKKVNLAAEIDSADYLIQSENISQFVHIVADKNFSITYDDKNGEVTKDISGKIFNVTAVDADTLSLRLACGSSNVRCDRLVTSLFKMHGCNGDYKVTKTAAYIGGKNADSVLLTRQTEDGI